MEVKGRKHFPREGSEMRPGIRSQFCHVKTVAAHFRPRTEGVRVFRIESMKDFKVDSVISYQIVRKGGERSLKLDCERSMVP